MANKLQIKRSAVSGKVPTTADLDLGELAINTHDGKLFLKRNQSGTEAVLEVGAAGGVGVPAGGTTGQVLTKASGTNYDTAWTTPSGGSGGGINTGKAIAMAMIFGG